MFRFREIKKGFSIIEMLVVVAVIVILTAILLIDYGSIKQQLALRRAANQFSQDIRATQGLALGTAEYQCSSPPGASSGFGICVGKDCFSSGCGNNCALMYSVFANCWKKGGNPYDFDVNPGGQKDEVLRTINLEPDLKICQRYDANCDGLVNLFDSIYIRSYADAHPSATCQAPDWCEGADTNRDGVVRTSGGSPDLISGKSQSTVVFEFPGPTTNFGGTPSYSVSGEVLQDFRIIINNDPLKARNVSINSAGLIEIK